MSTYIMDLRKIVGHRTLIQAGASIIIESGNKILLQLRTDNKKWGIPGGSIEIGESVEETAIREIKEETGLVIKKEDLKLIGVFSGKGQYYKYPNGDEVYNVSTSFLTDKFEGKLDKSNEESSSLKFFNIEDLPNGINPPDVEVLENYKKLKL